jgi:N-acetylmuramoyl-L-alanine amidase
VLDAAVVAYHAWKSSYSVDESRAWQDEYYTDIKTFYKKYALKKEDETVFKELKRGDRGEEVKRMQKKLGGLVTDGIFGRNTQKALKDFQKKSGLPQTGVLDSVTYKELYNEEPVPQKIKIALDDGHGVETDGKRTPNLLQDLYVDGKLLRRKGEHIKENEFNDAVCDLLEKSLERCGFATFRSAPEENDISLSERKRRIRAAQCDFSLSVHYNASNNDGEFDDGNGLSAMVDNDTPTSFAIDLAKMMLHNISKIKGQRIRGVTPDDLAMTNDNALGCPSCLIECGFMTNLTEMRYMLDIKHQKAVAEAITKALCDTYKVEYKEPDNIVAPQEPVDLLEVKVKLQGIIDELNDLVKNL